LPGNRSGGAQTGAASNRVTVTVHDLQAMDEAILAGAPQPAAQSGLHAASAHLSSAAQAVPSVAEARRLHEQEQLDKTDDAQSWYDRGLAAEQAGKSSVAKVYYQMVVRRASGEVRALAQARLEALRRASTPTSVARRENP
jgi:hypothetical protein